MEEVSREDLIREGEFLYGSIREEHFKHSRNQKYISQNGVTTPLGIPWMEKEAVCIALALYARKKGIQEAINNS